MYTKRSSFQQLMWDHGENIYRPSTSNAQQTTSLAIIRSATISSENFVLNCIKNLNFETQ